MNNFELFCLLYYFLDAAWEKNRDQQLGAFLSDANPFLFTDIGSANTLVYREFSEKTDAFIPLEDSYATAAKYVASIDNDAVKTAFSAVGEAEWIENARDYLAGRHKGEDMSHK